MRHDEIAPRSADTPACSTAAEFIGLVRGRKQFATNRPGSVRGCIAEIAVRGKARAIERCIERAIGRKQKNITARSE